MKLRGCAITLLVHLQVPARRISAFRNVVLCSLLMACAQSLLFLRTHPSLPLHPLVLHFPGPTGDVRNRSPLDAKPLSIAAAGCSQSFLCSSLPGEELWQ